MKQIIAALLSGVSLLAAGAAQGADAKAAEQLANKSGCLACHTTDKKVVGPAYKEVAAKYRGQKDAEAKLIAKVKNGGQGVWGTIPMPPNTGVKDEDIKTLVQWILSLK
jgi:cytochrome c